jgi:hypothetical protein
MQMLQNGSCERLKTGVHAASLALAAVCGLYNAAAWLSRRQVHLAVNTILYAALIAWEQQHVLHHLAELHQPPRAAASKQAAPPVSIPEAPKIAA